MDWMYLFYFALALLLFFGAKSAGRGRWNEAYTSLEQTKVLQGITALGIALHHMAQKTCAPWHPQKYTVHGLDPFVPMGYLFVGVFLFCSGLGLYKSFRTKPDYLKGFVRRRILPVAAAFYLSEAVYTAVRLAMGEPMDFKTVLWYLSGLHMANFNAWYVIVIPFFYLAFWAAFRFCRREGTAVFLVFLFTLAYTVLEARSKDHPDPEKGVSGLAAAVLRGHFPAVSAVGMAEQPCLGLLRRMGGSAENPAPPDERRHAVAGMYGLCGVLFPADDESPFRQPVPGLARRCHAGFLPDARDVCGTVRV